MLRRSLVLISFLLAFPLVVKAQQNASDLAVGSWFGHAVSSNPATSPFPEIYMTPTFFADGRVLANTSQISESTHVTIHGHWEKTGSNQFRAVFVAVTAAAPEDSIPNGYKGALKITLDGVINRNKPDEITGTLSARFFPSGIDPVNSSNTGSSFLGVYTIARMKRIKAEPQWPTSPGRSFRGELAIGSWFGRAVPVNPSTSPLQEVVMTPTFFADGNIIANDSHEKTNPHATSHGDWIKTGENAFKGVFIWMNLTEPSPSAPGGFAGAFKVTMIASIDPNKPDKITGTVNPVLFLPGTDPLDPRDTTGVDLGIFNIVELTRIKSNARGLTVTGRDSRGELAVGSWFGHAVSNDPNSPLGEVFMTPSFLADGNLIANDSHEETNPHTTSHGHWIETGANRVQATFVWLNLATPADSVPNGYTGAFKVVLEGSIDPNDPDKMTGTVHPRLFPPGTNPLDPDHTGSIDLGLFTIASLKRVKANPTEPTALEPQDLSHELAVGSWFGRALSDNPSQSPFPEIFILPTFFADGNLVANDSQERNNSQTTTRGNWIKTGENQLQASFLTLRIASPEDSIPSGFEGVLKIVLNGSINPSAPDKMNGTLDVRFFPPGTNPLDHAGSGSVDFGRFTIQEMGRIKAKMTEPTVIGRNYMGERVVGSWYGKAVPANPSTSPVPEVVMTPTFFSDGNLVANDSQERNSPRTTSHGDWVKTGDNDVKGVFVWINPAAPEDSVPSGYTGAIRVTLLGSVDPARPDEMTGTVNPVLFPPGTDPLDSLSTGGIDFGIFNIVSLGRVKSFPADTTLARRDLSGELSIGSWYGKAVPDNPSTSPFSEVVMTPSFFSDGNLIANDSHEETNPHTTSHGHWTKTEDNQMKAVFVWLNIATPEDSVPSGYTGAIKVILLGRIDPANPNEMRGTVNPLFFPPGTDPLDPNNAGSIDLGLFNIAQLTRIQAGMPSAISDSEKQTARPSQFSLEYAFPNPFNPTTTIRYTLPVSAEVKLIVYNILGQEVRTLIDGPQSAGAYSVIWNGRNAQEQPISSGVYFYRLTAGEFSQSRKMLLLK